MTFGIVMIGYGNIGQDFTRIFLGRTTELKERYGIQAKLVAVLDSTGGAICNKGLDPASLLRVKSSTGRLCDFPEYGCKGISVEDTLRQADAQFLMETSSTDFRTGEPGISNILMGIEQGLHIVTANKGALALAYPMLKRAAEERNVLMKFRGSAPTPLPYLDLEVYPALGYPLQRVEGVVNACANYILGRMHEGTDKARATEEARQLKLLERDPELDLLGWDTACKMVILANLLFDANVTLHDVKDVEGIQNITLSDVENAKQNRQFLKHVGMLENMEGKIVLKSSIKSYDIDHPFSAMKKTEKAMMLQASGAGTITMKSEHTGSLPSAQAMFHDMIDIRRHERLRGV